MHNQLVYIVDGMGLIFRGFHASQSYIMNSKGQDKSAIITTIQALMSYYNKIQPDYAVVVFDAPGGSFRNDLSDDYKSQRKEVDPQLLQQIPAIIELVKSLGFKTFMQPGFEADDIIATLATKYAALGYDVEIESGDKDFIQLIDKNITLVSTRDDKVYDYKNGHTKFGVALKYSIDYQAFNGDAADNIPGVAGVGAKTAVALIETFGGIHDIYAAIDNGTFTDVPKIGSAKSTTLLKKLVDNRDNAFHSYELATLRKDVALENCEIEDLHQAPMDLDRFYQITQEFELGGLRKQLSEAKYLHCDDKIDDITTATAEYDAKYPLPTTMQSKRVDKEGVLGKPRVNHFAKKATPESVALTAEQQALLALSQPCKLAQPFSLELPETFVTEVNLWTFESLQPQLMATGVPSVIQHPAKFKAGVTDIYTPAELELVTQVFRNIFAQAKLENHIATASQIAIYQEVNPASNQPMSLVLVLGTTLAQTTQDLATKRVYKLSFTHAGLDQLFFIGNSDTGIEYQGFKQAFKPLLEQILTADPARLVLTVNLKQLARDFNLSQDVVAQVSDQVHDVQLLAYTRNSALKKDLDILGVANYYLQSKFESVKYTKTKTDYEHVDLASLQASLVLEPLFAHFQDTCATKLYREIEQPLWKYLYAMEMAGIIVDLEKLTQIQAELTQRLDSYYQELVAIAGQEFNPLSPKQVKEVLYDHLGLSDANNKGSTAVEALRDLDHPIIAPLLNYRSTNTILSTHVTALMDIAKRSADHKVHTTYLQTQAVTGRLSSIDPNLQNVPSRGEFAAPIRGCFVAAPGYKIVSLDYSQIELRVTADLNNESTMISAFSHGEDIHAKTAANIFHVPINEVTRTQRQIAKAINFGLNYGKTAFSLASELNISRSEASEYINQYFATYPHIKEFITATRDNAKLTRYVTTLMGRVIPLPNINSSIPAVAESEKRNAINYPIQSSATEIIKVAMNKLYDLLRTEMPEVIPHLQIHDELVFSMPEALVDTYVPRIQQVMETCVTLNLVPLKVEYTVNDFWSK